MITTRSPFSDPEFLRSVHVVPFDLEAEREQERFDESLAIHRFLAAQEREEDRNRKLAQLFAVLFSVFAWIAIYLAVR